MDTLCIFRTLSCMRLTARYCGFGRWSRCEAAFGGLTSYDGERFRTLAMRGVSPALAEIFREPWTVGPGSFHERLVHGDLLVHADHMANPALLSGHPQSRGVVELGGARTG